MIEKIFLVHHTHTDIGYTDIQTKVMEDHVDFLDEVLDYCKETDNYPLNSKFKWTCEVSWTVKNYFRKRPERIAEFIQRVKEERIEITGFYLNVTELYTVEELIRSLYFAKDLEKRYGIKVISAMNSDVPGLSWIIPQILSKSGIKYLSMSTDPIRSFRPEIPYPFYWCSPDGSKVLTWNTESKDNCYQIGAILGFEENYKLVSKELPSYIKHLEKEKYPYDTYCIRMARDNFPPQFQLSQIAKEWNEKHEYPKIIISTNREFFEYMEKKYKDRIPSYNLAWPDWWADGNASAAYETGLSRNIHRKLINVEKLTSILSLFEKYYPEKEIEEIWNNIFFFDEHTWGAHGSVLKPYSLQTKAQWAIKSSFVYQAAVNLERLVNKKLRFLIAKIKNPGGSKFVIFNPLPYKRNDVVSFKIPQGVLGRNEQTETSFLAKGIPPLGYKTYRVVPAEKKLDKYFSFGKNSIENKFYKVVVDSTTGGIKSLYDKEIRKELVNQKSSYNLNQYIYEEIASTEGRTAIYDHSDGAEKGKKRKVEFRRTIPKSCRIRQGRKGPLVASLIVETKAKGCSKITQEIILYQDLKKIDIINVLYKNEIITPEAIYFVFPFDFERPIIKFEIAGNIMRPEIDQLPGTAKDYYSVQDWVSISDKDCSVVWTTKEAPLIQFSDINTGKWITSKLRIKNGTFFSWVMNNYWMTNFKVSQGGKAVFHYSITSSKGEIDNSKANRFAQECNNPLIALPIEKKTKGTLPEKECSFLSLDKRNISLLAFKKAEDKKGLIIRLIEVGGKDTVVKIILPFLEIKEAYMTNLVEENQRRISSSAGKHTIKVSIKPFGITTIRIQKSI